TRQNMLDLFSRHWGGWVPSAFRHDFELQTTTMIIHKNQRIGYFSLKEEADGVFLDNIQLSTTVQGLGLGTEILKSILANNSARPIRLTTFSDNPAIRLYKKLGFTAVKQEGATVHMIRPAKAA
ncbi:MAG: GNAT family N-acetyltransferase, partial [Cyanobacteria bacterium P01_A01_bin.17]